MPYLKSLLLIIFVAGLAEAQTKYVPPAPVQPIPFNHRQHLSNGLECKDCHESASNADLIGLPLVAKCMACHSTIKKDSPAIQKLAEYQKNHEEVPWKRVYRVPDFVSFTHKAHVVQGKVGCEECHGPVRERDVIAEEKDLSMGGCMECHRSSSVSVACDFCHDPQ